MKYQSAISPAPVQEPSEDVVRDYAYHLYEQANCAPGHDVDNWLEATACLKAHIPAHSSHRRLHQHINGPAIAKLPHSIGTDTKSNPAVGGMNQDSNKKNIPQ